MLSRPALKVIALFAAVELGLVGSLGSLAAKQFGFSYAALTPVAYLVYAAAGYFAARVGGSGTLAGGIVGLLDSLGWALFRGLGPQPVPQGLTPTAKAITVVMVTATALVAGALGGWLGGRATRAATS